MSFDLKNLKPGDVIPKINGSVHLMGGKITAVLGVQFTEVIGDFSCSFSNLTSLEGAPQKVDGDFLCSNNRITHSKVPQNMWVENSYAPITVSPHLKVAPKKLEGVFFVTETIKSSLKKRSDLSAMLRGMSSADLIPFKRLYSP